MTVRACHLGQARDLRVVNLGPGEPDLEHRCTLVVIGTNKLELGCRPAADRGIERFDPVRAHDDQDPQTALGRLIDATDQGVDPGAILVMHLAEGARLRHGVRFIDHEDVAGAARLSRLCRDLPERLGDQPGHLTDSARASGLQAQPEDANVHAEAASNLVAERLGDGGLSRPDVSGEHEQRRPPLEPLGRGDDRAGVVLPTPLLQALRLEEHLGFLLDPDLDLVESHEARIPALGGGVGQLEDVLE